MCAWAPLRPRLPGPIHAPLLAGQSSVPRDTATSRAKWECPAGKVSVARSGGGTHAATSAVPCAPSSRSCKVEPHIYYPGWTPSGSQIAPARRSYLGGRHASAGVQAALRPALRLDCTGDPGDSLPVPAEVGAVILPGSVRAWPASPRPPGAGHAGAVSPLVGPGQGLPGAPDLKASAL